MLTAHHLKIMQNDTPLWQDLNLSISPTDRLGIFAPSGYGKTTLARVLAGWQLPTQGNVLLDDNPLPAKGYCPVQLIPQHPEQTFNPARSVGASLFDVWQPDEFWFDRFSLSTKLLKRYPNEVSGGELARIALLRALAPQTRYLIADEITAQLDPFLQAQIWQILLEEAEQRPLGMVIISHNLALLNHVCTEILQPSLS